MSRALIYGLVILVAAHLAWFIVQELELAAPLLALAVWAAPVIAAALVSYLAPTRKFVLGLSMIIPTVLLPLLSHGLYQLRGNKPDFPGFDGAVNLVVMITPFMFLMCAGGASIGLLAANRWPRNRASPPRA